MLTSLPVQILAETVPAVAASKRVPLHRRLLLVSMVVNNPFEVKELVVEAEVVAFLVATLRQVATDTIRVGIVSAVT